MPPGRSNLVALDRARCLEHLIGAQVAAVAVTVDALPIALPLFVARIDDSLYVRAARSGLLAHCMPHRVVSLLICDWTNADRPGWSVSVTGVAETVDDSDATARNAAPLLPWTDDDMLLRVPMTIVTGRELVKSTA